jgi:hypothetical protein
VPRSFGGAHGQQPQVVSAVRHRNPHPDTTVPLPRSSSRACGYFMRPAPENSPRPRLYLPGRANSRSVQSPPTPLRRPLMLPVFLLYHLRFPAPAALWSSSNPNRRPKTQAVAIAVPPPHLPRDRAKPIKKPDSFPGLVH